LATNNLQLLSVDLHHGICSPIIWVVPTTILVGDFFNLLNILVLGLILHNRLQLGLQFINLLVVYLVLRMLVMLDLQMFNLLLVDLINIILRMLDQYLLLLIVILHS